MGNLFGFPLTPLWIPEQTFLFSAQFVLFSHIDSPIMFNSLSLDEWLGCSRHPPRSVLRPILVLINFIELRPFFLRHLQCDAMGFSTRQRVPTFFNIDEACFFTFAQYIEPFSSVVR